ncbi:hypothetical protein CC80DRAFT_511403 [Byssothecium circinans]|uniref:Uncharacterized protein n=1 Tax=Byssothecium circinans TaxID=147558 RepID=A0A6A5TC82_9PLEO|nr:hypothetical protein CC80DRAFT_511403 [Byssothecium circinans]
MPHHISDERREEIAIQIEEKKRHLHAGTPENIADTREIFTSREEALASYGWYMETLFPRRLPPTIPPAYEYIAKIKNTNFLDEENIAELTTLLGLRDPPYIGLGTCKGTAYRLVPDEDLLTYDTRPDFDLINRTGSRIMLEDFLGVDFPNELANAANDEQKNDSSMSSQDYTANCSSSSVDSDADGFVFYQLGNLHFWYEECGEVDDEEKTKLWEDTGYAVGVKLALDGKPGDVYIFFNYRPFDDELYRVNLSDFKSWFLPGYEGCKFACARIATSIEDLKDGVEFDLSLVKAKRPAYTAVARTADGKRLLKHYELANEPCSELDIVQPTEECVDENAESSSSAPLLASSTSSRVETAPESTSSTESQRFEIQPATPPKFSCDEVRVSDGPITSSTSLIAKKAH